MTNQGDKEEDEKEQNLKTKIQLLQRRLEEQNRIKTKSQKELNMVKEKLSGGTSLWKQHQTKMSLKMTLLVFLFGLVIGGYLNQLN